MPSLPHSLEGYLDIPLIAVVGSQSSGKSSLIEAISGVYPLYQLIPLLMISRSRFRDRMGPARGTKFCINIKHHLRLTLMQVRYRSQASEFRQLLEVRSLSSPGRTGDHIWRGN